MASNVTFTEKAIALYGAKQTGGFGVPETLSSANAFAVLTGTSDPNISTNEEQMMGDSQSCEVLTSTTDVYQEVKAESVVPRVGSLFGKPIYGTEQAILTFIDTIASGTIIFAGATMTVGSSATPVQLAEELLAYLNGGSATQAHSTFTGTPNAGFSYILNSNETNVILAVALTANTNVTSLTLAGTQSAKATLVVSNQNTGSTLTFPFMTAMEASRFHANVTAGYSITDALRAKYVNAEAQLQKAYTENNWTESALINAERTAKKLDLLDLGATGNTAVDTLLANLVTARAETADILAKVTNAIEALKTLITNLKTNLVTDATGAVLLAQLLVKSPDAKTAVDLIDVATLGTTLDISNINSLSNSNTAVEQEFTTLKIKIRDFYSQAITKQALLPALVTTGTYAAKTYIDAADTAVGSTGSPVLLISDLVPVLMAIEFTNEYASTDTLTIHFRQSSDNLAGKQKTTIITDAIASADLTIEIGQRPKMAFNFMGNLYDVVNLPQITYPIAQQLQDSAYVTKAENVRNASLQEVGSGLILNNVCFSKLSVSNIDRFDRQRVMTGCEDTWDVSAKYGSATLTILEPEANTNIVDQFNVEDSVGKDFWFNFKQDGTTGNTLEVTLTKLTLKGYKRTAVNNRAAFDLDFTYSGFAKIELK